MRSINCGGQSHKTLSINCNFRRERRAEADWNQSPSPHRPKRLTVGPNQFTTLSDLGRLFLSQVAIEQALEKVCTLLPSTARAECTSLISLYAPAIINLLMQEVKPQEVCRRLGLCSSSARGKLTCKHGLVNV